MNRRPNQTGSLQTLERNGHTVRRYRLLVDGKRRFAEMEATKNPVDDEIKLRTRLLERLKNKPERSSRITVDEAMNAWLEEQKDLVHRGLKRETTVSGYRYIITSQVSPKDDDGKIIVGSLGLKRVSDLTEADLQGFFAAMDVSLARKRKIHNVLKRALPDAPFDDVEPPSKSELAIEDEARIEVEKEIVKNYKGFIAKKIIEVTANDEVKQVRWLLRCMGLRQGEVLGLRISDFVALNTKNAYVSINQQNARHDKNISGEVGLHATKLKTKDSKRSIALPDELRHKIQRVVKKRLDETGGNRKALLFVNSLGNPIRQQTDNAEWRRLCERMGIEFFRPHLLRAMAATLMRDRGATDAAIMTAFGWSNLSMLNLYDKRGDAKRTVEAVAGLARDWY